MRHAVHSAVLRRVPRRLAVLTAGLLMVPCMLTHTLQAQAGSAPVASPPIPAAPDAPSANSAGAASAGGLSTQPDADQGPIQKASSRTSESDGQGWSRAMLDPFQPGPNFGNFSGAPGGGAESTPDPGRFGRSQTGGFQGGTRTRGGASWGETGLEGRVGTAGPLFPATAGPTGSAAGSLPSLASLSQALRGSYALPLNAGSSRLRFSLQDQLRPNGSLSDLGRPNASAMFTTSDLGNGIFLSAGTSFGRNTAGAPAAGLGSNLAPEGKHSGPSLAIKLSF